MTLGNIKGTGKALEGLKVVDFGWNATVPFMAKYLGDFGATVVKVESAKRPDTLRNILPFSKGIPGLNRSLNFLSFNSSKYSMALDLRHPRGVGVAKRLVSWADTVLENFMPGTMEKLGLGYEELKRINPGVIMVRASLQGGEGPHSQVGAVGVMMQALTGIVYPMGWPDGPPTPIPCATTDFITPFWCMAAIFAALDNRRKTGEGKLIDFSQYEAGVTFTTVAVLNYLANGQGQCRRGNSSPNAVPHNAYRCQGEGRWCAIAVFHEEEWRALCGVMGNPPWTAEKRFSTFEARKENEAELDRFVEEWTLRYPAGEVMKRLQPAGVPAGIVQNGRDLHTDPQLKHRHHFWTLPHPEVGQFTSDGPSFRLSETPAEITRPAPCLGEHTELVCREMLGMSDEEFVDLFSAEVLE